MMSFVQVAIQIEIRWGSVVLIEQGDLGFSTSSAIKSCEQSCLDSLSPAFLNLGMGVFSPLGSVNENLLHFHLKQAMI